MPEQVTNSYFRKDKPVGQIFGSGFSWSEATDAAADVYNGVSIVTVNLFEKQSLKRLQYIFWSMLTSLGLTVWCEYMPMLS